MTQEYVYLCQQIQFLKKFYLTYILEKKKKIWPRLSQT